MLDTNDDINNIIIKLKQTEFGTWQDIADYIKETFGEELTVDAVRKRYYRQKINDVIDESEKEIESEKNPQTKTYQIESDILTLTGKESIEDLIEDAGLEKNQWEVLQYKAWEVQVKGGGTDTLKSVQIKRKVDEFAVEKLQEIVNELKTYSPKIHKNKTKYARDGGYLFVPCLFDVHFGKPNDKDTEKIYEEALGSLVKKVQRCGYKIDEILFPVGNDLMHFDGLERKTTAGTLVSSDMSMYSVIDTAVRVIVNAVNQLEQYAPVHVSMIGGNHDRLASYWLGQVVDAYYHGNSNVVVDNSPMPRKYFLWDNILLGMTHGNEEKSSDMAALMAVESPELWGKSNYREWLTGHLHKRSASYHLINEEHGVTTRIIPSLCDSDDWHILKGFVGNHRIAEGYIYGTSGLEDQLGVNIGLD